MSHVAQHGLLVVLQDTVVDYCGGAHHLDDLREETLPCTNRLALFGGFHSPCYEQYHSGSEGAFPSLEELSSCLLEQRVRPSGRTGAASSTGLVQCILDQSLDPQLHELQVVPDNREGVRLGLDLGDRGGGPPRRVAPGAGDGDGTAQRADRGSRDREHDEDATHPLASGALDSSAGAGVRSGLSAGAGPALPLSFCNALAQALLRKF
mmetsp:Transcript_23232/g.60502  ORF Transcript_23232/g.60502 Transcript_23232/m.60502 type:complete len:208 (+) Transcript_23232:743-1366(+)